MTYTTERPSDAKECILKGFHEQSAMILERLERVIASYEARREALIVEGVHLTLDAMARFRV